VVFGEVACRPGGACVVDQMNYTIDIDLFREWARVATVGPVRCVERAQVQTSASYLQARARPGRISANRGADRVLRQISRAPSSRTPCCGRAHRGATGRRRCSRIGYLVVRHSGLGPTRAGWRLLRRPTCSSTLRRRTADCRCAKARTHAKLGHAPTRWFSRVLGRPDRTGLVEMLAERIAAARRQLGGEPEWRVLAGQFAGILLVTCDPERSRRGSRLRCVR